MLSRKQRQLKEVHLESMAGWQDGRMFFPDEKNGMSKLQKEDVDGNG